MDPVRTIPAAPLTLPEDVASRRSEEESFADTLKDFAGRVDSRLKKADRMKGEFAVGLRQDIHEIMIASEKAGISLRFLIQIRNKLLEGYQEVMRMQF
jgi:flagellar hook-basal body complex protein FliE